MVAASFDAKRRGERRVAERHDCKPEATCRVTEVLGQKRAEALPWNVSNGGVCVLVAQHYASGTRLEIELRAPDEDRSVVAFGEVIYAFLLPSEREMYLTGCEFQHELRDDDLRPYT
jgi:hypothetical protein